MSHLFTSQAFGYVIVSSLQNVISPHVQIKHMTLLFNMGYIFKKDRFAAIYNSNYY